MKKGLVKFKLSSVNKYVIQWKQLGQDPSKMVMLEEGRVGDHQRFQCNLCAKPYSVTVLERHVRGNGHRRQMYKRYWIDECGFDSNQMMAEPNKNYWECKYCIKKFDNMDWDFFTNHCKLHKTNIVELWKINGGSSLEVINQKQFLYCCNVCNLEVSLSCEEEIKHHLDSVQHKKFLLLSRRASLSGFTHKFEINLDTFVCKCCNVSFNLYQERLIDNHIKTEEHERNCSKSKRLKLLEEEFFENY